MPQHDFSALYDRFPTTIMALPTVFTSHELIQRLARDNQGLYIAALQSYSGSPDPFRRVHAVLAQRLHSLPQLVRHAGTTDSPDLFGDVVECGRWERV